MIRRQTPYFEPTAGGSPLLQQGELDFNPAEKRSILKGGLYRRKNSLDEGGGLQSLRENHRSGLSPAGTPELSPGRQSWVEQGEMLVP